MPVALAAAKAAEEDGRSVEVIDLRSISPIDFDTVTASVEKTGRLIVTHEAPTFGGLGGEIAARVTERSFLSLEAPVLRVGGFHMPYPVAKVEEQYLPDIDRILEALDRSFAYYSLRLAPLPARPAELARHRSTPSTEINMAFNLPDVGEGLTEAEIVTWKVKPGTPWRSTTSSARSKRPSPWWNCQPVRRRRSRNCWSRRARPWRWATADHHRPDPTVTRRQPARTPAVPTVPAGRRTSAAPGGHLRRRPRGRARWSVPARRLTPSKRRLRRQRRAAETGCRRPPRSAGGAPPPPPSPAPLGQSTALPPRSADDGQAVHPG